MRRQLGRNVNLKRANRDTATMGEPTHLQKIGSAFFYGVASTLIVFVNKSVLSVSAFFGGVHKNFFENHFENFLDSYTFWKESLNNTFSDVNYGTNSLYKGVLFTRNKISEKFLAI